MKIQTYNDITIQVLSATATSGTMKLACDVTQKRGVNPEGVLYTQLPFSTSKFLITAEHTSILEHASMSLLASGISRSLLAQVTRQRHFSFTSASQHYQDYRDYPMSLRPDWEAYSIQSANGHKEYWRAKKYAEALQASLDAYIRLIELGEKPEEARQVLPNACTVNLVITANPRALLEFLTVRLCKRNTLEMQIFAEKLKAVCEDWLPEIFKHAVPYCKSNGHCNQGKMTCLKS